MPLITGGATHTAAAAAAAATLTPGRPPGRALGVQPAAATASGLAAPQRKRPSGTKKAGGKSRNTTGASGSGSKKKQKVSRPLNSFMVFSNDYRKKLQAEYPDKDNKVISKMLGAKWASLLPPEKEKYVAQAKKLADQHKIDHPEWRFTRNTKKRKLQALQDAQAQEVATKMATPDLARASTTLPNAPVLPGAGGLAAPAGASDSKAKVKAAAAAAGGAGAKKKAPPGTSPSVGGGGKSGGRGKKKQRRAKPKIEPIKMERAFDETPSVEFVPSPATPTPQRIHYGQRPLIGEVPWPIALNGGLSASQVQKFDRLAQLQLQAMIRQQELRHQSPEPEGQMLAAPPYVPPPSIDNL